MGHFKVLPTDARYKDLTVDQIEVLYLAFINRPTDQEVLHTYRKSKTADRMKVPTAELEEMGFNPDEIVKIAQDFASVLGGSDV